jgi:hypothetical protein
MVRMSLTGCLSEWSGSKILETVGVRTFVEQKHCLDDDYARLRNVWNSYLCQYSNICNDTDVF